MIRTNPLIDARKAEGRLAANLRRQRDIQKQREETQLRLEKKRGLSEAEVGAGPTTHLDGAGAGATTPA